MKIIEPNVEYWEQGENKLTHVARCARICYRKETGNDDKLYRSLLNRKHNSMFRHATYYFIIPSIDVISSVDTDKRLWIAKLNELINDAKQLVVGIDIKLYKDYYYIVTNGNWNLDHQNLLEYINTYAVTAKEFINANEIARNMMRYTFKITTQISTSRELNRVSPNNISEQSTRYVYEDGTICRPHWMTKEEADTWNNISDNTFISEVKHFHYINSAKSSFDRYKLLIENSMPRQDARGVLPLDTATRCVYTYSVDEWFEIIKKRVYNITGKSHPNATIICKLIEQELNGLGYEVKI